VSDDQAGTVAVAYLHRPELSASFATSLEDLKIFDMTRGEGRFFPRGGVFPAQCGTEQVAEKRNEVTQAFLDGTRCEWLWFIDSDMGFAPDTLERLIASADPTERPIVGALCWSQREVAPDPELHHPVMARFPTLYDFMRLPDGTEGWRAWEPEQIDGHVHKVDGTGAACLLIHRSVFEKVRAERGDTWWSRTKFGEDLSFCLRAQSAGFTIHVDTAVRTSHHKEVFISGPDPAPVRPLVGIPVLNHWEDLTLPLLRQLLVQDEASHIMVMDNGSTDDTRAGCDALGVGWHDCRGWNIHAMWNFALSMSQGRPVAILNNDLAIGPNFLARLGRALQIDPQLAVVCPNYDGRIDTRWTYTTEICAGRYDGTGGIAGFAFMAAADWAGDYRFPEQLTWWFGDNHLVATAALARRRCAVIGSSMCEHLDGGGKTGSWDDPKIKPTLDADRRWFENWMKDQFAAA